MLNIFFQLSLKTRSALQTSINNLRLHFLPLVFQRKIHLCNHYSTLSCGARMTMLLPHRRMQILRIHGIGWLEGLVVSHQLKKQSGRSKVCVHLSHVFITSHDLTAKKVKWFCAHAAHDCAWEEEEILEEEFEHAHRLFEWMVKVWMELSEQVKDNKGAAGYNHKQSPMYQQLAIDCGDAFQKVCSTTECSPTGELPSGMLYN